MLSLSRWVRVHCLISMWIERVAILSCIVANAAAAAVAVAAVVVVKPKGFLQVYFFSFFSSSTFKHSKSI